MSVARHCLRDVIREVWCVVAIGLRLTLPAHVMELAWSLGVCGERCALCHLPLVALVQGGKRGAHCHAPVGGGLQVCFGGGGTKDRLGELGLAVQPAWGLWASVLAPWLCFRVRLKRGGVRWAGRYKFLVIEVLA